jgi:peptide deformylase
VSDALPYPFKLRFDPANRTTWAESRPVVDIGKEVRPYLLTMYRLLKRSGAISLSAQQVGLPLRFYVWMAHRDKMRYISTVINPVVAYCSSETFLAQEADASSPGKIIGLARPIATIASYERMVGEPVKDRFMTGLESRVLLHEVERMNGLSPFAPEPVPAPCPTPGKESTRPARGL